MCILVVHVASMLGEDEFYSLHYAHLYFLHIMNVSSALTGKEKFKGMVIKIVKILGTWCI